MAERLQESRYRQYTGVMKKVVTAIAVTYSLFEIAYLLGFLSTPTLFIYPQAFRAMALGLMLVLVFLIYPATKAGRHKLPWYDILLIIGSLVGTMYIFVNWASIITFHLPWAAPHELVLGVMFVLILLEATRRTIGLPVCILAAFFIPYAVFSDYFPGILAGKGYSFSRVMAQIYVLPGESIFGWVLSVAVVLVFGFIIFGAFLQVTGAGRLFVNAALSLVGHVRGGPGKVAVIASGLFGMISGSAVANVAGTGIVTIPLMKQIGYKPHFAGAVEAVASTGGQLMPPVMGAAAFLMAEFLEIPYIAVCFAALVPALLYYMALFLMIDFEAAKTGIRGMLRQDVPSMRKTIKDGWHFIIPLLVLVFFLAVLGYSPQTSCLYALGTLIVVSMIRKATRLNLEKIVAGLRDGALGILDIGIVCATIGIVVSTIHLTGLGLRLSGGIRELAGGNLMILLLLAAGLAYVLGMGLPTTTSYILLAILVAPALTMMGVLPIAAHLFIFYWGLTAMITPPACPAAFIGAALAGAPMMRTGYTAMRLGVVVLIVPFVFVYHPALILIGSPGEIVLTIISTTIGVVALVAAVSGYLFGVANPLQRLLYLVAAIALINVTWITGLIGGAALAGGVFWQLSTRRRPFKAAVS